MSLSSARMHRAQSYALGWIRMVLRGALGTLWAQSDVIVGKGIVSPELMIHHQGSISGFLSSIHLIPRTRTAVVVLTNSMAKIDAADWLGQLIVEAILDNSDKNDYVKLANTSAETSIALWSRMACKLEEDRIPNTPRKPNQEYVGSYYNLIKDYYIEIYEKKNGEFLCASKVIGLSPISSNISMMNPSPDSWLEMNALGGASSRRLILNFLSYDLVWMSSEKLIL